MKINFIMLSRLRNDAHFQLHTEFKNLMEEFTAVALNIVILFQAYLLLYAKLDAAFKKIIKSIFTEQIYEADKARDEVWKGLVDALSSALRHFDPVKREVAKRLKIVFDTYGNIARKSLNEETSAIYNIVQELESAKYAVDITTLSLGAWVIELKARNITFANLMRDRVDEESLKDITVYKKMRALLDDKFYEIVDGLNAQAALETLGIVERTGKFDAPIRKLNIIIAKFALLVQVSKKGKKGKKEAENTQTEGE